MPFARCAKALPCAGRAFLIFRTQRKPVSAYPFVCRGCGHVQIPLNPLVQARLEERGLCQGCRAAETLRDRPWLLAEFVDFWRKNGFPESASWLRALPASSDVDSVTRSCDGELRGARPEEPS